MLDYLVLYQSETGNTKKIAATIFAHLPGNSKDLIDLDAAKEIPEAGRISSGSVFTGDPAAWPSATS